MAAEERGPRLVVEPPDALTSKSTRCAICHGLLPKAAVHDTYTDVWYCSWFCAGSM